MKADNFNELLFASLKHREDIEFDLLALAYDDKRTYWFPRLASLNLRSTSRTLLIRAGIHGEEVAGPMTILDHGNEIFDYAHRQVIKLIIYPLGNPAGFEAGTRYSPDCGWAGFDGNNDFWKVQLPRESSLIFNCLEKDLHLADVLGVLDLHQDYITKDVGTLAYHYAFGDLTVYKNIIAELRKLIPVGPISTAAGYFDSVIMQSDKDGFIARRDGSLTDWVDNLGIKYNVAVETTGCTPLDVAMKVNLVWIKGFIDLIANNH